MPSSLPRRSWTALCALGLSCAPTPPPASPELAPAEASAEPAAAPEPSPAEAAATEPAAAASASVIPKPMDRAPEAAQTPQDTRTRSVIQAVMAENRGKVRACYDAALAQNPGIHGALVIGFVIDPRGNVKQAEVNWSESDIHVPELDTCAVDAIRAIKFPPSSRGLESSVNYPFNFNPPRTPPPGQQP
jgi:TonB family protein